MPCRDCEYYQPIDELAGRCKYENVERHLIPTFDHNYEVINGWPIVQADEGACGKFE